MMHRSALVRPWFPALEGGTCLGYISQDPAFLVLLASRVRTALLVHVGWGVLGLFRYQKVKMASISTKGVRTVAIALFPQHYHYHVLEREGYSCGSVQPPRIWLSIDK